MKYVVTLSLFSMLAFGGVASAEGLGVDQDTGGGPPAKERPRSLGIFVLSGEEVGAPRSEMYSSARREIEAKTALDVGGPELFPSSMRETAIRECAGDSACFAERSRQAGVDVDLLLLVSAARVGEGVLLGLRLVDLRITSGKAEIAAVGEQLPEGMSLIRAMGDYLGRVFPPEIWGQVSSVKVDTNQENAEVLVGTRACVSPCKIERMLPGRYDIVVRKSGYEEWRGAVNLSPEKEEVVTVSLIEEPGSVLSSPWFWGAVGVGAAAAVVATVLLVQPSSGTFTVCIAQTPDLCEK